VAALHIHPPATRWHTCHRPPPPAACCATHTFCPLPTDWRFWFYLPSLHAATDQLRTSAPGLAAAILPRATRTATPLPVLGGAAALTLRRTPHSAPHTPTTAGTFYYLTVLRFLPLPGYAHLQFPFYPTYLPPAPTPHGYHYTFAATPTTPVRACAAGTFYRAYVRTYGTHAFLPPTCVPANRVYRGFTMTVTRTHHLPGTARGSFAVPVCALLPHLPPPYLCQRRRFPHLCRQHAPATHAHHIPGLPHIAGQHTYALHYLPAPSCTLRLPLHDHFPYMTTYPAATPPVPPHRLDYHHLQPPPPTTTAVLVVDAVTLPFHMPLLPVPRTRTPHTCLPFTGSGATWPLVLGPVLLLCLRHMHFLSYIPLLLRAPLHHRASALLHLRGLHAPLRHFLQHTACLRHCPSPTPHTCCQLPLDVCVMP